MNGNDKKLIQSESIDLSWSVWQINEHVITGGLLWKEMILVRSEMNSFAENYQRTKFQYDILHFVHWALFSAQIRWNYLINTHVKLNAPIELRRIDCCDWMYDRVHIETEIPMNL